MPYVIAFGAGIALYAIIRVLITGFYIVRPDQRAVLTSFGRADRLGDPGKAEEENLSPDEQERYRYPKVRVIQPGDGFRLGDET